jgi:hypothetical protein
LYKVAGGLVIFEVQRSARSEARKEEKRRQEIEVIVSNLLNILQLYYNMVENNRNQNEPNKKELTNSHA